MTPPKHMSAYLAVLTTLLAILWVALAIEPFDRKDWLLENVLVVVAVAALAMTYRSFPLSRISYTLIFLFLCLHTLGAHYTYAQDVTLMPAGRRCRGDRCGRPQARTLARGKHRPAQEPWRRGG